ncbi:MAG: hypothetical protein AMK72_06780 [Planctomycetes bacterium SM23_25]|nr:MAG: hypothetical protein AMK72_06780 [Planctomycetes bacterium SM23_25]
MSQLADGELPSDQANELLLRVLDAPADREKLEALLRLRHATVDWRTRQPPRPVMIVADRPRTFRLRRTAWGVGGLAAAACVGGLLALAGVWGAGRLGGPVRQTYPWPTVARVTREQMQQVAMVFALHESVAGPLAWYAADDRNIRLASAGGTEAGQTPIAVLLKLGSASPDAARSTGSGQAARTLLIVCREDRSAVIELPADSPGRAGLRVYLAPRAVNGKVEVQYAIAVDGAEDRPAVARLAGQRRIGLAETPLGQVALGDRLLSVEAAAWPLRQEGNR